MFGPPTLHVTEPPFVAVDGRIESYTSCCSATVEEAPRRTPLTLSDLNQSASRLFAEPFAAVFGKRWRIRTRLFSFFFFFSFFLVPPPTRCDCPPLKVNVIVGSLKNQVTHTHTGTHMQAHTHSGTGQNKKRQLNLALTLDLTWPELTLPYFLLPNARYKMYFAACACVCVCVRANVCACVCVACQLKAIPNPQSVRRAVFVGNFKAVTRKTTSTLSVGQASKLPKAAATAPGLRLVNCTR